MLVKAYNSHGCSSMLGEIYELETIERGNCTFEGVSKSFIEQNKEKEVIWITFNPLEALRYSISAGEYYLTDDELKEKYPSYMEGIVELEIENEDIILGDDSIGYLVFI